MRLTKFIIFLFLIVNFLYAEVQIKAPKTFLQNEAYIFTIIINNTNVKIPDITLIDSFPVTKGRSQSSYSNINGEINKEIITQYILYPTKDFIIPAFTFSKNSEIFKTKEVFVKKRKMSKTISPDFDFFMSSTKKEVFVGEELLLKITFKYKKNLRLVDLSFENPSFDNFWSKQLDNSKKYEKDEFIIQELYFLLFAQKSGLLEVPPLRVNATVVDYNQSSNSFFNNNTALKKIYSNNLLVKVKSLPSKLSLVGDFKIKASVNKKVINYGESVSYKLNISGYGNVDDIKEQYLKIDNTTIYDNKAVKKTLIKNNKYYGTYDKTFSILASNDFIIEPIIINYYDLKTNTVKKIKTESFQIKVLNVKVNNTKLEKDHTKDEINEKIIEKVLIKTSIEDKIIYFIFGSLFTLLIFGLFKYSINYKRSKIDLPLVKIIKKTKNKDELLKILTPYVLRDKNLDKEILSLESLLENDFKTKKKDIISIVKTMKI